VIQSYKYRINPNRAQAASLSAMLGDFCQLYNAALEHRIRAYEKGVSIKCNEQIVTLPVIRRDDPDTHGCWSCTAQQQVLRKLDKTFQAFFSRVKRGAKAGFPRFRASARYHAADFRVGDGLTIRKSGKLGVVGVPGEIKVRWHRELPSKPKSAILTRNAGKWHIIFHVEVATVERASPYSIGLDMGLTSLVALSNGETVARPGWTKRAAKGLRTRQRAVARCKRGSKVRRKRVAALAVYHSRIGNRRRDFTHKITRDLVNRFGRIAIENLNIKGLASGMLAKHVHDAAWAQIVSMLRYKAESASCEFVEVDPRGTSQTCPECGIIAAKTLAIRGHRCECGCVLDRDVAAAKIVHFRAFGFVPGTGIGQLTQRVAA
jgi:putative transposase